MQAKTFAAIIEQLNRGESPRLELRAEDGVFYRRFTANERLILLGCGHVSADVCRVAKTLDFDIVAVDDRPAFANSARFPDTTVLCDDFVSAIRKLQISERDYVCVLTRGHLWDAQCIREILSGAMPYYLGLISSRRRAEGLRQILAQEGYDRSDIDRIHAPIGLDIGARTTAEIAVSVCAQLIQARHQREAKPCENELLQTNVNPEVLRYLAESDEPRALVIVLDSTGSTPVKSGSMMAVNRLGAVCGTVGGGCGEAAAINKARRIIESGGSAVIEVDMTNEVAADNDMVCGGSMRVLIENVF